MTPSAPRRIHVDTDPGLDDLLALALALASPEVQVEAITTVFGNASVDAVTRNAKRFLALAGSPDIPVGRGADQPLSLERYTAEAYHGEDGRRGVPIPALDGRPDAAARDVMKRSLRDGVERVVALGPLTNVALVAREDPGLFRDVEIVWMGGTLGRGNVTGVAEFNAFADPAAASLVLGSGLSVRMIGLDVTENVVLQPSEIAAVSFGNGRRADLLRAVLAALIEAERSRLGELAVLHDPCAVFAAFAPDLFRYEDRVIEIAVEESDERGRIQGSCAGDGTPVRYATEAHTTELKREFLARLSAWAGDAA